MMDNKDNEKLTWYEIIVDIIPTTAVYENKLIRTPKFYVRVMQFEEYKENGHVRMGVDPEIGKYSNSVEYSIAVEGRDDIESIIIADTIMDADVAWKLEENLVNGFRSSDAEYGYNRKVGEN